MGHDRAPESRFDVVHSPTAAAAHRRQILTYAGITLALIAALLVLVLQM